MLPRHSVTSRTPADGPKDPISPRLSPRICYAAGPVGRGNVGDQFFVSYSSVDGSEFALSLADKLAAGPPPYAAWVDKRKLQPGREDWDDQVVKAATRHP